MRGRDLMNNDWQKRFFESLKSVYKDKLEIIEEKIDGKDTLNIILGDGSDDGALPYDCSVTVDDNEDNGTACVELLMMFRDGIPAEKINGAIKLVSCFNSAITIGFFGLIEDTGSVYFNCAFNVIAKDEVKYYTSAVRVFGETARIAVVSVEEADEYLERFVSGETSLDELIAEDVAIIQEIEPEDYE